MKKIATMGLIMAAMLFAVPKIYAQVSVGFSISARIAPPPLRVYVQPPCPEDGYLWQPGYWAYDPDAGDYYWVSGVWVAPPSVGLLWTPSYWGYSDGVYGFYPGYWGSHVGFYGGVNYGGGYFGTGFAGGGWQGNHFRYNTAVVRVNTRVIHNTYVDRTVISRNTIVHNRVSYNGGKGGVTARPRPQEQEAMREHHVQPTRAQVTHQQTASRNKSQFANVNHNRPAAAAATKGNANHAVPAGNRANGHVKNPAAAGRTTTARQPNTPVRTNARPNVARQPSHTQQQRAPQQHAQPQRAPQQRAQPQQRAPQQRAPQQHAQPQRAPQQRAPQQRAPQQHAPQPHGGGGGEPHERHR